MNNTDRLAAIRARLSNATAGPWYANHCHAGKNKDCWCKVIGTSSDPQHEDMDKVASAGSIHANDADLIAHAPDDIAFLLAEVERLRGDRDKWLASDDCYYWTPEAQAERDRLRAALEFIADGCLVPPDGGSPCFDDAIEAAREALQPPQGESEHITAAEFDRRAEAGEDMSQYFEDSDGS